MKLSFWLMLSALLPAAHYELPADHFSHPDFQSEWWYYTGNLSDLSGHRYGFELTFFRQTIHLPKTAVDSTDPTWRPGQIYLAHLALSDIDGHEFIHTERLNRAGPGLAGADINSRKYWNGNWQVYWSNLETGQQQLQAVCEHFVLTLDLAPMKRAVINGKNGLSQKGPGPDEASHYISFTRLAAHGQLRRNGAAQTVTGLAWMDHEFFTSQANSTLGGWDWFAIQLGNNEELMLYRLRAKTGEISPYSSGTYVDSAGIAHHLTAAEFVLTPGRSWHKYPVEWGIEIPALAVRLYERTELDDQELATDSNAWPSYWEGAVTYQGTMRGQPIQGVGYLEMTGYSQPVRLGH
jgi:predicted secreted hydrolase